MVRPQSCQVIYYFDTPTLGRRHQLFGRVRGSVDDSLKPSIENSMGNGKGKSVLYEQYLDPMQAEANVMVECCEIIKEARKSNKHHIYYSRSLSRGDDAQKRIGTQKGKKIILGYIEVRKERVDDEATKGVAIRTEDVTTRSVVKRLSNRMSVSGRGPPTPSAN